MMKCTGVVYGGEWNPEKPDQNFCRCPICKGFLPKDFPDDKPFTCKKCGTELMVFPVSDEENGEHGYWDGKICPISLASDTKRKDAVELIKEARNAEANKDLEAVSQNKHRSRST